MYVSEIPMHLPDGVRTGHSFPRDHDRDRYKIVYTRAIFRPGATPVGPSILTDALNKEPVIEAWIDRSLGHVTHVFSLPEKAFYDHMPVPVF